MGKVFRRTALALAAGSLLLPAGASAAKIRLTIWDWHEPRLNLVKEYAAAYSQLHPDIEFEFSLTGWNEFWSKLPVAIAAGTPPDITMFHNEKTDQFVEKNMLLPFPESLFSLGEMDRKYVMFRQAAVLNGKMYFLPDGIMTAAIYYNKDLLTQAGLAGVPDRWDELVRAAKKLTRTGADGRISQVGFSFAGDAQYFFPDLVYQRGGYLFKEKGGVAYGEEPGRQAIALLDELLKANISDGVPGVPSPGSFESGKQAMRYSWTWYNGVVVKVPDLNWGVAKLPTWDGSNLPARGRNNYESGFAVPVGVPPERQVEAFKFLKWLYDNEKYHIQVNMLLGRVPGLRQVWRSPELLRDPVYQLLIEQAPYTVYPGPLPSWLFDVLGTMKNRILNGQAAPQVALDMAVREGEAKWREIPGRFIVERQYQPPR